MPVFGGVPNKEVVRPNASEPNLAPKELELGDGTKAVLFPLYTSDHIPLGLLAHMTDEFNDEIERGQTYPLASALTMEQFKHYWCDEFTAILLKGSLASFQSLKDAELAGHPAGDELLQEQTHVASTSSLAAQLIPHHNENWSEYFLGTFHVLPNYPDRCSHVCNAGFFIPPTARGKRIGSALGKMYLEWAPQLGYTYSVFNLVFETNVASLKIWEGLGFERIGRVKGAGRLKGYKKKVDAIIIGKQLVEEDDEDEE